MFEYVPSAERQGRKGAQPDGARECSPTQTVPTWNPEVVYHRYGIYRDIPMLGHLTGSCTSIWQRPCGPWVHHARGPECAQWGHEHGGWGGQGEQWNGELVSLRLH